MAASSTVPTARLKTTTKRNSGKPTIVMSNFAGEMLGLYRDEGDGLYREESVESGVGHPSEQLLGFGVFHLTSAFIHFVLVLAVIVAVIELFRGRSAV